MIDVDWTYFAFVCVGTFCFGSHRVGGEEDADMFCADRVDEGYATDHSKDHYLVITANSLELAQQDWIESRLHFMTEYTDLDDNWVLAWADIPSAGRWAYTKFRLGDNEDYIFFCVDRRDEGLDSTELQQVSKFTAEHAIVCSTHRKICERPDQ